MKQFESRRTVAKVYRDNSISTSTYFKWKTRYGGMEASDLERMRDLEEENRQLKRLFRHHGKGRFEKCSPKRAQIIPHK